MGMAQNGTEWHGNGTGMARRGHSDGALGIPGHRTIKRVTEPWLRLSFLTASPGGSRPGGTEQLRGSRVLWSTECDWEFRVHSGTGVPWGRAWWSRGHRSALGRTERLWGVLGRAGRLQEQWDAQGCVEEGTGSTGSHRGAQGAVITCRRCVVGGTRQLGVHWGGLEKVVGSTGTHWLVL